MTRRKKISRADLTTAFGSAIQSGLSVRSARVFPDGGFVLEFGGPTETAEMSDLDMQLQNLEARYGEG